ncbi:unnamed protein product [Amoebophrya sp. A25]|nr:unnamed protein product [Amoebophrya sp. A25]|eukprot:GSA25T00006176001.1
MGAEDDDSSSPLTSMSDISEDEQEESNLGTLVSAEFSGPSSTAISMSETPATGDIDAGTFTAATAIRGSESAVSISNLLGTTTAGGAISSSSSFISSNLPPPPGPATKRAQKYRDFQHQLVKRSQIWPVFTPTANRPSAALLNYFPDHVFGPEAHYEVPHVIVVEPSQYDSYFALFPEHVFLVLDRDGQGVGYSRFIIQLFATAAMISVPFTDQNYGKELTNVESPFFTTSSSSGADKSAFDSSDDSEKIRKTTAASIFFKDPKILQKVVSALTKSCPRADGYSAATPATLTLGPVAWASRCIWVIDDLLVRFYSKDRASARLVKLHKRAQPDAALEVPDAIKQLKKEETHLQGRQRATWREALLELQRYSNLENTHFGGFLRDNGAVSFKRVLQTFNTNTFKIYKAILLNIELLREKSLFYIPYVRRWEDIAFMIRLIRENAVSVKVQSYFYVASRHSRGGCADQRSKPKYTWQSASDAVEKGICMDDLIHPQDYKKLAPVEQDILQKVVGWVQGKESRFLLTGVHACGVKESAFLRHREAAAGAAPLPGSDSFSDDEGAPVRKTLLPEVRARAGVK